MCSARHYLSAKRLKGLRTLTSILIYFLSIVVPFFLGWGFGCSLEHLAVYRKFLNMNCLVAMPPHLDVHTDELTAFLISPSSLSLPEWKQRKGLSHSPLKHTWAFPIHVIISPLQGWLWKNQSHLQVYILTIFKLAKLSQITNLTVLSNSSTSNALGYSILNKFFFGTGRKRSAVLIYCFYTNGNIYTCVCAAAAAKSLQSCTTLCDPIDGSPPGSPVSGILQARTLEWVAISFSNAWKWKGKVKSLSRVRLLATPWTAAHQAPPSTGFSRQEYWSGVPWCVYYINK